LHTPDLHTLRKQLDEGSTDALTLLDQALAAARSPRCAHAFVSIDEQGARTAAAAPAGALAGLPISVKDLYDIAGQVTSAGSVVLADQPPAPVDAPAVARLR
jgi:Asp-tRNA(Asn)/Glu-tRNA(Gln) amidotransferase A subunit family amidase